MKRLATLLATAIILLIGLVPAVPAGAIDGAEPVSTFATGLLNARDIEITDDDTVYVADTGNNRVLRIANGVTSVVAGNNSGTDVLTSLNGPQGIAVEDDGTLWISDTGNGRVLRIAGSTVTTVASALNSPAGIAVVGGAGHVAETGANRVLSVTPGGTPVVVAGDNAGTPVVTTLTAPTQVVALDSGFMVVDNQGHRVVSIDGGAVVSQVGNGIAGSATEQLNNPFGAAVGPDGIYVADTFNNNVRKFPTGSTNGVVISQAWSSRAPLAATPTDKSTPIDLAFDSDGSMYVLDFVFNWILKVDATDVSPFEVLAGRGDLDADHANILRLYWATFDREPDVGGAEFWIDAFNTGSWPTLVRISEHFVVSAEFLQTYGETTNTEFVDALYFNILGRQGDAGGRTFWIGELDSGSRSRGEVLADFSFSAEFRTNRPLPSDNVVQRD